MTQRETHTVKIAGLTRHLQLLQVAPGVKIAIFNMLGDTEVIEAAAKALAKRLPKEAQVVRLPSARVVETRFGEFSLATERSPAGVTIRSTFVVTGNRIAPADYPAFRAFLRDTDTAIEERLVVVFGGPR